MRASISLLLAVLAMSAFAGFAAAQTTVYYDFENANSHSPLPVALTVDGVTAHFSGDPAYYNYSIQPANTMGFTPVGFSGLCIYPSSINKCDLLIAFDSTLLTDLSLLYAPQELNTSTSCTMRITAYSGSTQVATATHQMTNEGTWPSDTLAIHSAATFDNVRIHYESPPPTGGEYGVIFMVDNVQATTAVPEPAGIVGIVTFAMLMAVRRASRGSRSPA